MMKVMIWEMIWMEEQILQTWLITKMTMMILRNLQILDKEVMPKKRICKTRLSNHQSAGKSG